MSGVDVDDDFHLFVCIFFADCILNKVSCALPSFCLSSLPRENDITGVLDHTFCVEHNAYGEIIPHELKPNGKSIPVDEETKKEYVRYRSDADTRDCQINREPTQPPQMDFSASLIHSVSANSFCG